MARLYDISGLHFIPNLSGANGTALAPAEFFQLSYQRRYFQTPAFDLLRGDLFLKKINPSPDHMYAITTRSVYPPVNFLLQGLVAGLGWRVFNLPIVPVTIACRMVGLLMYILGIYVAIRLLPLGKWVMAVLALAPMSLFTAATLNIDSYSTMTAFVFIALVLNQAVAFTGVLGGRQVVVLLGAALAMALARPNSFLLLPLLFALSYRRFQPRRWYFILWGGAAVAVVLALGWNFILPKSDEGGLLSQARLVLATPLHFIKLVASGVLDNLERYYREWVGVYGHWLGVVPTSIYWLYPLALLVALLGEGRAAVTYPAKIRWLTFAMFLLTTGGTITIMYMIFYHGIDERILGVQGRYFLPLVPLLLLPLSGLLRLSAPVLRVARGVAPALVLVTLGLYALGLGATYYTNCGASFYTGAACQQPIYKNLDKSGAPEIAIKGDISVSQTFKNTCGPIEKVNVLVKSVAPNPQGNLHFELLTAESQPVAGMYIPASEISPLTYLALPVNPAAGEKGKIYRIRVESNTSATQGGVSIAISHTREFFDGKLLVNGQMQNADMIFRYFCVNPYQ